MTEQLVYTSSPVFEIDGEDRGELARDVVHLEVAEGTDGLKTLMARFVAIGPNGGEQEALLYLDGQVIDFGKQLRLSIGPPNNQRYIFDGYISALEVSFEEGDEPEVCVHAEDRLMDLRMTRRARSYEEMSDADIAGEIAAEHGLNAQVDADGPTYDRIQQWNMSDLAFLRERARLIQAEVWVDGDDLFFKTRDRRHGTEITLLRGTDIITVQACADLAHQRTAVRVSGYDAQQREVIDEEAGDDAIQAEVSQGRSGPSVLQSAFGERISRRVREVALNSNEAAEWARAEMLRRSRRFITVNGVTRGTPDMIVGSLLDLQHMGTPFNGSDYYVTHVCHSYDLAQGHRTTFCAERATLGSYS
ncbi:MAG: phage late control D family protein [Gammaproteobacteria bacterium]|nr:phage late control D family protein [Gammaproteobacteria bacterium]